MAPLSTFESKLIKENQNLLKKLDQQTQRITQQDQKITEQTQQIAKMKIWLFCAGNGKNGFCA